MKIKLSLSTLILVFGFISCGNEELDSTIKNEDGIISNSIEKIKDISSYVGSSLKSGINKADTLIIKKPFEYLEHRAKTADSLETAKINGHRTMLETKYLEYSVISRWFESNPSELQGIQGNYYKILNGVIENGKSVERIDMINKNDFGTYRYFFETEDAFFLYELELLGDNVSVINIRRIMRGMGDEPMHDLFFDKGVLRKEVYQCEVNTSFYDKKGSLYFEQYMESEGKEITNTIQLNEVI